MWTWQSVAEERARQARSEGQNLIERLQHKDKGERHRPSPLPRE